MKIEDSRLGRTGKRAVIAALASVLLASCTTSGQDEFMGFSPSAATATGMNATSLASLPSPSSGGTVSDQSTVNAFVVEEGDPALPETVATAPFMRPGAAQEAMIQTAQGAQPNLQETTLQQQAEALGQRFDQAPAPTEQPIVTASVPQVAQPISVPQAAMPAPRPSDVEVASQANAFAAVAEQPKKRGFFASLFGNQPQQQDAPRPLVPTAPAPAASPVAPASAPTPAAAPSREPAKPLVQLASNGQAPRPLAANIAGQSALPGVRQNALYEISRRTGVDESDDIDVYEDEDVPIQVAFAAGLARLAPNGLMRQTDHVDVACLKPSLVRTLKAIENHFGRKVMVTSGYRNPTRNAKARGAKNSLHMYCAAADVKVEGVSKAQLASFARTMPGRGGVGTYCHTDAVHIDVGPERDWNWRCRRRK